MSLAHFTTDKAAIDALEPGAAVIIFTPDSELTLATISYVWSLTPA